MASVLRHARAWLAAVLCAALATSVASGAPPSFGFRTNDVIAFVGGEDVVEMQRNGYLELLLTAALPHHKLRFRNLAFEGDTVFEQHRQLNFPSWEKQLERVGATVVIAQFGQAESLQGTNELGKFMESYTKLIRRFTNGGQRLVLLSPTPFEKVSGAWPDLEPNNASLEKYAQTVGDLATNHASHFVNLTYVRSGGHPRSVSVTRDGLHLNQIGHFSSGQVVVGSFNILPPAEVRFYLSSKQGFKSSWEPDAEVLGSDAKNRDAEKLRQIIVAKNRLWFDYWRPQNWAFLNGDRTEQPSSRDHRDMKKRWFPEEMEKFLPLIEAKEREIWKLAAELK